MMPRGEGGAEEEAAKEAPKISKKKKRKGAINGNVGRDGSDVAARAAGPTTDGEGVADATAEGAGVKKAPASLSKKLKVGTNNNAEGNGAEGAAKETPKSSKKKKSKGAIDGNVGGDGLDVAAPAVRSTKDGEGAADATAAGAKKVPASSKKLNSGTN